MTHFRLENDDVKTSSGLNDLGSFYLEPSDALAQHLDEAGIEFEHNSHLRTYCFITIRNEEQATMFRLMRPDISYVDANYPHRLFS